MPRWDIEVLFPLTLHFPTLRSLEVKYVSGWPDEQTIISLGPQFLLHLPYLEVLHIYNPISPRCTCLSSRALEVRLSTLSSSCSFPCSSGTAPTHSPSRHTPIPSIPSYPATNLIPG
ncbi:hypothetical protein BDQ17DRAFT_257226 [Cyathus striatus]|nr:hypothetical protein BDQ17DRAFT_257226 [Cyathus striatus]